MSIMKQQELEAARARLAALEQQLAEERNAELRALPARYGFESLLRFTQAVRIATGERPAKRKARAVVTPDIIEGVARMVKSRASGYQIAQELCISLPTVYNIKKALGLVKARS